MLCSITCIKPLPTAAASLHTVMRKYGLVLYGFTDEVSNLGGAQVVKSHLSRPNQDAAGFLRGLVSTFASSIEQTCLGCVFCLETTATSTAPHMSCKVSGRVSWRRTCCAMCPTHATGPSASQTRRSASEWMMCTGTAASIATISTAQKTLRTGGLNIFAWTDKGCHLLYSLIRARVMLMARTNVRG